MATADLTFTVPGAPQAKGRHRTRVVKAKATGKVFAMHYADPKTKSYEGEIKFFAAQAMRGEPPFTGPIHLEVQIWVQPPQSWPAWKIDAALKNLIAPDCKPDKDNVEKAAADAINGIVYADDSQIVGGHQVKRYSDQPRLVVLVYKSPRASSRITRKDQLAHAP